MRERFGGGRRAPRRMESVSVSYMPGISMEDASRSLNVLCDLDKREMKR
jgi:hypothetical protein